MKNHIGPCAICGATDWVAAYDGPIRDGVFGRECHGTVVRCQSCAIEMLAEPRQDRREYYADGSYRRDVGEGVDAQSFFERHDREQFHRLALLERTPIRDRVIVDVGSGAGSFLDGVRGYASQTIAVEPDRSYHDSLAEREHSVYVDTRAALCDWAGRADVVVSFSVIEHVEDPVALLTDIRRLLAPSGVGLVSTPNRNDVLLATGCDAYRRFFYRVVHLYYFDEPSLRRAATTAGLSSCDVIYRHRFPFSNFVAWLQQGRPTGGEGRPLLGHQFDRFWLATLEESGRADYLYAFLRR